MTELRTLHKYISQYPIDPESTKLILGTIHPHRTDEFILDFFYGNRASLWKIFSEAFPLELPDPLSVEGIRSFLQLRKISISDTVLECGRKSDLAFDADMTDIKCNDGLLEQIRNSKIKEIYFTSSFQKNNAFRLFYENILGLKLKKEIRQTKETVLDTSFFGREVKLKSLISPSGAANISLSKSPGYLALKDTFQSGTPVNEYKVFWYRNQFLT